MDRQILKVIHENYEIRLRCRYTSVNTGLDVHEEYECRLGRVDDRWDLRVQRRPPDGHRLKFGQQLTPNLLPSYSHFGEVGSDRVVSGLKAWAGRFDFEVEDSGDGRHKLLPKEVSVTLRLPRRMYEDLERRSGIEPDWSLNDEVIETLRGKRQPI